MTHEQTLIIRLYEAREAHKTATKALSEARNQEINEYARRPAMDENGDMIIRDSPPWSLHTRQLHAEKVSAAT